MFYNDEEKNKIAWQEYASYKIGDKSKKVPSKREVAFRNCRIISKALFLPASHRITPARLRRVFIWTVF